MLSDLENKERDGKLSELQIAVLLPAIRDAHLELKVKIGAKANGEMASCLISGKSYITYYLGQLNVTNQCWPTQQASALKTDLKTLAVRKIGR